ncbi:MAG: Uma2 family endonuclease [Saprospiraceae bacterium]
MLITDTLEIEGIAEKMTDAAFEAFCSQNRHLRIERDSSGNVIVMPPVHTDTGKKETTVQGMVFMWNFQFKRGEVFNSSTGFTLPNGAMRAADTAFVSYERWDQLTAAQKKTFAPVCPNFVVEIRSDSDKSLPKLKSKMMEWVENGVQLGWLLDTFNLETYLYRGNGTIELVKGFDKLLSGEEVLPDFTFDLGLIA